MFIYRRESKFEKTIEITSGKLVFSSSLQWHFHTYFKFDSFHTFSCLSDSPALTVTGNVSPELVFDWIAPFVPCFVEQIRNILLPSFWLTNSTVLWCCLILCCLELSLPFVASLCYSLGRLWALDLNHWILAFVPSSSAPFLNRIFDWIGYMTIPSERRQLSKQIFKQLWVY